VTHTQQQKLISLLNINFRFRFWPEYRQRNLTYYWSTKFRLNWITPNEVMTSYPFFKMAATASQVCFLLRLLTSWF